MPTEKTKAEYRKLAKHFYEKRLGDEPPSPKRIADALAGCAGDYRPAYWRRLRCALAFDQQEKGYKAAAERIRDTDNPRTVDPRGEPYCRHTRLSTPPKQSRAKSITPEDGSLLWHAVGTLKHADETRAAIRLALLLGVRPAEMPHLRIEGGAVHVTGVKKSGGKRGADRVLVLENPPDLDLVAYDIEMIQQAELKRPGVIHRVQSRLDRLTRKLWPRRQARPTLYTFRHMMGSRLKASGADRTAIAYVMGHQSTKSVEVYGDRRSAKRSEGLAVKVGEREAAAFEGRENHREPHAAPAERSACGPETPVQQEGSQPPTPVPYSGPSGPGM